jgi:hypothetical protein
MTLQLTEEQHRLLLAAGDTLPTVVDSTTGATYVLLPTDVYAKVRQLLDFSPADVYPAIDEAFREGWDDPKMAEYDHYEEHKR